MELPGFWISPHLWIIISSKESGEISTYKGQIQKSVLDFTDLWALRQHTVKNRHDYPWKRVHGLRNTFKNQCLWINHNIHKCRSKLYRARRTWSKNNAVFSESLMMSWIKWWGKMLDRPEVPKCIVKVYWECLAGALVHEIYNSRIPKVSGDTESK